MNWLKQIPARIKALALCVAAMGYAISAQAADTDLTTLVSDASTLWDAVKVVVLAVITFSILLGIAKMLRKR